MTGSFLTRVVFCLSVLLLCIQPRMVHAAAWLLPQGQSQLIQTISAYRADTFYSSSGTKTAQPDFTKLLYNPYYEYGFSDTITGGVSLSFERLTQRDAVTGQMHDNNGIGDSELFLRKQLWKSDSSVLSLQPLIKLPRTTSSGNLPALGSDTADAEIRLLAGHSFARSEGRYHFVDAELAYRTRFGSPGDQWRLDAKLGLRPIDRWMLLTELNSTWHVGSFGTASGFISSDENYDLVKAQISAVYELSDSISVQAGIFSDIYSRNTGSGEGVLLSIWYKL